MVPYLGSLVQWGRNAANKYHWCAWGVLAVSESHWVCPCSQYVCFPRLHCSGYRLLCRGTVWGGPWDACTSQIYAAQVQVLGYSTKVQAWLGPCFVPFPGPRSSGDQMLGEGTLPKCRASYHLPGPGHSVSWVQWERRLRCVVCLFWGAQVTRCLVRALSPSAECLITSPSRPLGFLGAVGVLAQVCCVSLLRSSGDQMLGEGTLPKCGTSYHFPVLATWFPGCSRSMGSGVPCVSSEELISGCDPPGRCQLSRIPGRLG